MHNKYLKILVTLLGLPLSLLCQSNHGFAFDNYSGIYGVISNPANSVDSKYRIHVNILSYNQLGVSDIGSLTNFQVETAPNGFNGLDNFTKDPIEGEPNGYAFGHSDVLLPSVTWNFHEKYAIGLLLRSRSIFDYNDTNLALLRGVNDVFVEESVVFPNSILNNTEHSWAEIGLNLSTVLLNTNYHFIKFGGTFKYFMGNRASEIRGSLAGDFDGSNLILNTPNEPLTSLNTFGSLSGDDTSKPFITSAIDNFSGKGSGIGGDVGFVYEWRPRETNRVDVRSNSGAVNKYKLKISASVLDIGVIDYKNKSESPIRRNVLSLNDITIPTNTIGEEGGLISALIANGNVTPSQGDVKFALPMSLNLNVDYIVLNDKNYYININYIKGLTEATDDYKFTSTQIDLITVTPRYETRKISAYLPINFQPLTGEISAGLGVRYGPVTIGAAALSSMLMDGKMSHLYFGVSIPLMKELYR